MSVGGDESEFVSVDLIQLGMESLENLVDATDLPWGARADAATMWMLRQEGWVAGKGAEEYWPSLQISSKRAAELVVDRGEYLGDFVI